MRTLSMWALGVLLLAGCSGQSLLTLEVPQAEIQKKLDEKFPISPEGDGGGMPFKLTLSQPKVSLQEAENRIVLELALGGQFPGVIASPVSSSTPRNMPVRLWRLQTVHSASPAAGVRSTSL